MTLLFAPEFITFPLRQTYAFDGSLKGDRAYSVEANRMATRARSLSSASALAAHTAMCVQLEGIFLRGDVVPAASVKSRRIPLRRFVLFAAVLLSALS
jgi:hypothetical protein